MRTDELVDRLAAMIEIAARKSVPWPGETFRDDWDDDSTERPWTLEDFVKGTYINYARADGTNSADEVFRAAAEAAAVAVAAEIRRLSGLVDEAREALGMVREHDSVMARLEPDAHDTVVATLAKLEPKGEAE